ncbi:MAG TPA: carboxypeptidase-like regulatory domain-containing protein [Vicinamibacterales bacterium]
MARCARLVGVLLTLTSISVSLAAQGIRGVVVDQTGLPLPGVRVDLYHGSNILQNLTTEADGGFTLTDGAADDVVELTLEGFETIRVPLSAVRHIVLPLAHASEITEVVGDALMSSGSSMEHLGSTMTAPLAMRLPAPRPRILQSLPLLPAVVRGTDGLLRIGGTRPHESSLWIDGFDVTDPVTLTTAIDLPNESVKGMAVVRDPISATFSGVLGSMASIETTAGSGAFTGGLQGFIPRPRLNARYGLGRIEAFYPRAYVSGRLGSHARFFASAELNFERVPVPGVTNSGGTPAAGAVGVTSFVRVDADLSPRNTITFEALYLPANTSYSGLSPLLQPAAAPDVGTRDLFGGIIDRIVLSPRDLLTLRVGIMNHDTTITPSGAGPAILRPDGWQQNWFSDVDTSGMRRSASIAWDRSGIPGWGTHTFSMSGDLQLQDMSSAMNHQMIRIEDDLGRLTRSIDFMPMSRPLEASDTKGGAGFRDLWDLTSRLQLDLDLRLDWYERFTPAAPSPRLGVRYVLNESGATTFKASAGRFVGRAPLGATAFAQFPARLDRSFDPATGALIGAVTNVFVSEQIKLPSSIGYALELEHAIRPGLDAQAAVRVRDSSDLPTVTVNPRQVVLASTGTSQYRELQVSVRQTWRPDALMFVSYVHSTTNADVNDFGTMFTNLDAPYIEPAGQAPAAYSVPNRLRAWSTLPLPYRIVVSPAVDWRTGFPYSLQDEYRHYVGVPNSQRLPPYFSVDLTTFKTFEALNHSLDLGLQVFNLTNHFNPRDVIAVVGSARFGELTNNPGVLFGGYMQVRW